MFSAIPDNRHTHRILSHIIHRTDEEECVVDCSNIVMLRQYVRCPRGQPRLILPDYFHLAASISRFNSPKHTRDADDGAATGGKFLSKTFSSSQSSTSVFSTTKEVRMEDHYRNDKNLMSTSRSLWEKRSGVMTTGFQGDREFFFQFSI